MGNSPMTVPFNTKLLDEVLIERQENCEQERQQVFRQVLEWLHQSGGQYGIDSAYLFGSVTQLGRFHKGSDVDLGVEEMALLN